MSQHLPNSILGLPIYTDFRVWVSLPKIDIKSDIKRRKALCNAIFVKEQPASLARAEYEILNFYSKPYEKIKSAGSNEKTKRAIDFEYDFELLASAFIKDYNIDLWNNDLHYYKFVPLYLALDAENLICRIMNYRTTNLATIKDAEQRLAIEKMQKQYALPLTKDEQEEEEELQRIIQKYR